MDSAKKIKKKQQVILIAGTVGVAGMLMLGLWLTDPNKDKPTPMEEAVKKSEIVNKSFSAQDNAATTAKESWIAQSEVKQQEAQDNMTNLQNQINKLKKELAIKNKQNTEAATSNKVITEGKGTAVSLPPPPANKVISQPLPKVNKSIGLPPNPTDSNVRNINSSPYTSGSYSTNMPGRPPAQAQDNIQVVDLDDDDSKKNKVIHKADEYLPSGSFSRVVLLSGVDAPSGSTAKAQPVPVLLRVADLGQMPNYWKSNIKNCHVTAAASGDLSSERAYMRLEKISCVLLNGDVIEKPIQGYVAGEDGKAGMRGRVVSRTGTLIARTLLAGTLSGLGGALSQSSTNVSTSALGSVESVDPDKIALNGFSKGAEKALDKLADYYLDRANQMYPIIEIDANRIGEMVLLNGLDLGQDIINKTRTHD